MTTNTPPLDLEKLVRQCLRESAHEYAKRGADDPEFKLHDWVDGVTQKLMQEIDNQQSIAAAIDNQWRHELQQVTNMAILTVMDAAGLDVISVDMDAQRTLTDRVAVALRKPEPDKNIVEFKLMKKEEQQ